MLGKGLEHVNIAIEEFDYCLTADTLDAVV